MGTGIYGGFKHTKGAPYRRFTAIFFSGEVIVEGEIRDVSRRVYQRNDIDFNMVDRLNRSNLDRMLAGLAPLGSDGRPIQLHHVIQAESGPVVEIREITHREYHRILHGLRGDGMSFRNDPNLRKQFNNFRSLYWKWRAKQYLEGK